MAGRTKKSRRLAATRRAILKKAKVMKVFETVFIK